jgi:hypothetical protein
MRSLLEQKRNRVFTVANAKELSQIRLPQSRLKKIRGSVIVFDMKQNTLVNFLFGHSLPFQSPPTSLSSAES